MKFDFAIGNPPYQDETLGDNKGFAPPVYNKFLEAAYAVANVTEMIHPARFLFDAGSTPKAWNEKMLNDPHLQVLLYEEDATKIFSNTEIKGGVAISYHDKSKEFGAIHVFTKYPQLNTILKKVSPHTEKESLMNIIYIQNKFNLDVMYADHPELMAVIGSEGKDKRFRNNIFDKVTLFTESKSKEDDIAVLGVINNKRQWRYFPKKYIDIAHDNIDKWKVLVARVNGAGTLDEVLSSPLVAAPFEGYTQTFIGIGAFECQSEAENALKYVKTKFTRTMLHVLKVTQDNNRDVWKYVPIQDFSKRTDIDWSVSVSAIDQQLYKKYGLTGEEISFIETHVKEMA